MYTLDANLILFYVNLCTIWYEVYIKFYQQRQNKSGKYNILSFLFEIIFFLNLLEFLIMHDFINIFIDAYTIYF